MEKPFRKLDMTLISHLKCRRCGTEYDPIRLAVCEKCYAPVDAIYDYSKATLTKETFTNRPRTIWRYDELLPVVDPKNKIDINVGFTPLVKCENLGRILGLEQLYVKNDAVNPTYSFKDRPAEIAVSKALEFGDKAVGCASTGNLAAAVAAHAAKAGLPCYVLAPVDIEAEKIAQITAYNAKMIGVNGTYDDANRLAVMASEEFGWNIVNITTRPYYVEGSKTMAFEIAEQLGWKLPDQILIPVASGALLSSIHRGFAQIEEIGFVSPNPVRINGAQAEGCGPIAKAFEAGDDMVKPVEKPDTIAKSIAIGDPGDGIYVLQYVRDSGGIVGAVSDEEIIDSIKLLARTEGIFTEPAGAVSIALLRRMVEEGKVSKDESIVCC
ncbi:MAG: threonine synthase, partial [Nitrososphaerales archaeon]